MLTRFLTFVAAIVLGCFTMPGRASDTHWGYANFTEGGVSYYPPSEWWNGAPACGASFPSQSPIDISTVITAGASSAHRRLLNSAAAPVTSSSPSGDTYVATHKYQPIKFTGDYAMSGLSVQNNGHAMQVNVGKISGTFPTATGGGTDNVYDIQQFHFHWGVDDTTGSEHTFDLTHAPLEMHIVTSRAEFHTMSLAASATDGLAVIGVFFKIGEHNAELQKLLDQIGTGKVLLSGSTQAMSGSINMKGLLPKKWGSYYSYHGSLTTPPCYQSVVWHLLKDNSELSAAQMTTIRTLSLSKTNASAVIGNNIRPLQPRKGRKVWYYEADTVAAHHEASSCHDDPFMIPTLAAALLTLIIFFISMNIWLKEGFKCCAQPPWDPKSWDSTGKIAEEHAEEKL